MKQVNLDSLKEDILKHLEAQGFVIFQGFRRGAEARPTAFWNTRRGPDFREFAATASQAGVRMMVFDHQEFDSGMAEDGLEQLDDCDIPADERRAIERRLRELIPYDGFTCELELSYDLEGRTYVYELRAEWYGDFLGIMDEIESYLPEADDGGDEEPMGGYYSRN